MEYEIKANSTTNNGAALAIKQNDIGFGITSESEVVSPNPAELFLGSFAACILKNIERFSNLMKFTYSGTDIIVKAKRTNAPPRMTDIVYDLTIYSDDSRLNVNLLKKNIEKFGTIYNTVKLSCSIASTIRVLESNANTIKT
ncbi:OsmC family protein [Spongiivirga citrea]|uniref:OsmC family peroxiredoxin n=1 Tax=Spongiivirga citrea TaxID=1481457 RepID=A0A6M0CIM7_9FLAO|nr:OsmC family protein [Spongiivirga citrea]NER16803.1 OsmC family peroxiredoxin [Spongiivirga citrea]